MAGINEIFVNDFILRILSEHEKCSMENGRCYDFVEKK